MSAIFISHSSKDNARAGEIKEKLLEQGHRSVFLDFDPEDGIPAGRNWEKELYAGLRACQAVIVLCSEHSVASPWCFAEITQARSLGKHLFPLNIGACQISPLLGDVQVTDLTLKPAEGYQLAGARALSPPRAAVCRTGDGARWCFYCFRQRPRLEVDS